MSNRTSKAADLRCDDGRTRHLLAVLSLDNRSTPSARPQWQGPSTEALQSVHRLLQVFVGRHCFHNFTRLRRSRSRPGHLLGHSCQRTYKWSNSNSGRSASELASLLT